MEKTKKTTSSGQEVRPFANLMMDTAFKISFGKEGGYEVTVDLICDKKNTQMALSYNTEMLCFHAVWHPLPAGTGSETRPIF